MALAPVVGSLLSPAMALAGSGGPAAVSNFPNIVAAVAAVAAAVAAIAAWRQVRAAKEATAEARRATKAAETAAKAAEAQVKEAERARLSSVRPLIASVPFSLAQELAVENWEPVRDAAGNVRMRDAAEVVSRVDPESLEWHVEVPCRNIGRGLARVTSAKLSREDYRFEITFEPIDLPPGERTRVRFDLPRTHALHPANGLSGFLALTIEYVPEQLSEPETKQFELLVTSPNTEQFNAFVVW